MKFLVILFLFISVAHGQRPETVHGDIFARRIKTIRYAGGIKIKWIKTIMDPKNIPYVVKSEIYPEDPNTMFLTLRGGGLTIRDISNPASPKVVQRWNKGGLDMEGQDRKGNIFISIARRGELLVFKINRKNRIYQIARLKLPTIKQRNPHLFVIPALHTRIYKKGNYSYALITCPWSKRLLVVDITIPQKPKYISGVNTRVKGLEAIQIHKDHAYVGGFRSHRFRVFDLSDLHKLKLVQNIHNNNFSQMVPEMSKDYPNILFSALWGKPGGVVAFDLTKPNRISILDMALDKAMAKANRVKIKKDLILLPLEQSIGGLGIVKIRKKPFKLVKQLTMREIPDVKKPYTMNYKGDYIYIFGSETDSMAILKFTKY